MTLSWHKAYVGLCQDATALVLRFLLEARRRTPSERGSFATSSLFPTIFPAVVLPSLTPVYTLTTRLDLFIRFASFRSFDSIRSSSRSLDPSFVRLATDLPGSVYLLQRQRQRPRPCLLHTLISSALR